MNVLYLWAAILITVCSGNEYFKREKPQEDLKEPPPEIVQAVGSEDFETPEQLGLCTELIDEMKRKFNRYDLDHSGKYSFVSLTFVLLPALRVIH